MKLQNNFTTPEQSKRLLELGLPIESADCFYNTKLGYKFHVIIDYEADRKELFRHSSFLPIWSVGRLIEILSLTMHKCDFYEVVEQLKMSISRTQDLVQAFSEYQDDMDFSKLED